jgi:hypothetical protein
LEFFLGNILPMCLFRSCRLESIWRQSEFRIQQRLSVGS